VTYNDAVNNVLLDFKVLSSTFNSITCSVPAYPSRFVNGTIDEFSGSLVVEHNFIAAACANSTCAPFRFLGRSTPTVTGLSMTFVSLDSTLGISGTLLTNDTVVKLDSYACGNLTFVNSTYIECIVPAMEAGSYPVSVFVPALGNALNMPSRFSVTQHLRIDSVFPSNSSLAGGTTVTITGEGFSSNTTLIAALVNNNSSVIISSNYSSIVFVTHSHVNLNLLDCWCCFCQRDPWIQRDELQLAVLRHSRSLPIHVSDCVDTLSQLYLTHIMWKRHCRTHQRNQFGNISAAISVVIGGVPCALNASTCPSTQFNYTIGVVSAGTHRIFLTRAGFGTAASTRSFAVALQITSVTSNQLSFGGGNIITISGSNFGTLNVNGSGIGSIVSVCNTACKVLSNTFDSIQCLTSPLITRAALDNFKHVEPEVLVGTSSSTGGGVTSAFDSKPETFTSINPFAGCFITYDLCAATETLLTRIRYFPRLANTWRMVGARFAVSTDSVNYVFVHAVQGTPSEGWNTVSVNYTTSIRFIRYFGSTNTFCQVAELEYSGYVLRSANDSTTLTSVCGVAVGTLPTPRHPSQGRLPATSTWIPALPADNLPVLSTSNTVAFVQSNFSVTFSADVTSVVTSVSQAYGSALGGTELTIGGLKFPALSSSFSVLVNGYPCDVPSSSATQIVCTTSPRGEEWFADFIIITAAPRGLCWVPDCSW
jgi:hypothetical protein